MTKPSTATKKPTAKVRNMKPTTKPTVEEVHEEKVINEEVQDVQEELKGVHATQNDMEIFKSFFEYAQKSNEQILLLNKEIHTKKLELERLEKELSNLNNVQIENESKVQSIIEKYKEIYLRENYDENMETVEPEFKGFGEDGKLIFG